MNVGEHLGPDQLRTHEDRAQAGQVERARAALLPAGHELRARTAARRSCVTPSSPTSARNRPGLRRKLAVGQWYSVAALVQRVDHGADQAHVVEQRAATTARRRSVRAPSARRSPRGSRAARAWPMTTPFGSPVVPEDGCTNACGAAPERRRPGRRGRRRRRRPASARVPPRGRRPRPARSAPPCSPKRATRSRSDRLATGRSPRCPRCRVAPAPRRARARRRTRRRTRRGPRRGSRPAAPGSTTAELAGDAPAPAARRSAKLQSAPESRNRYTDFAPNSVARVSSSSLRSATSTAAATCRSRLVRLTALRAGPLGPRSARAGGRHATWASLTASRRWPARRRARRRS